MKNQIVIAGAGIGGLALACALRRSSVNVAVYERAESLRPVGAGLTLQPNAMTALRILGLSDRVEKAGRIPERALVLQTSGRVLSALPLVRVHARIGAPTVCIHRAKLQAVLLEAIAPESVVCGRAVTGFVDEGSSFRVRLSDGSEVASDGLVGADGVHSVVRENLLGAQAPVYSGYTSWRGVCAATPRVDMSQVTETWGTGSRFGVVPISDSEVYWFATRNAPAGGKDKSRPALLDIFGGWHSPIAELIESTSEERIIRTDIHDRPAARHWTRGRVALLGDAAHPMTPNLGQGGCQAIEDAVVLGNLLMAEPSMERAFQMYESRRASRANRVVALSRRLGLVAQWESRPARAFRDWILRSTPTSLALRQAEAALRFEL